MHRVLVRTVTISVVTMLCLGAAPAASAADHELSALPSQAELREARLRLSDLPAGYSRDRSADAERSSISRSSDPACSRRLDALDDEPFATPAPRRSTAKYHLNPLFGPFVESSVAVHRTAAELTDGFAELRRLLRVCERWTEVSPDGSRASVRLSRLPLPRLGDQRLAMRVRITARGDGVVLTGRVDLAFVRVGNGLTSVSVLRFEPADVDYEALAALSTERLVAIL